MRLIVGAALVILGLALLAWGALPTLHPTAPYEARLTPAAGEAMQGAAGFGVKPEALMHLEIRTPQKRSPVAMGVVARDAIGRLTPLFWSSQVTEPIFFADVSAADALKVLTAIRDHTPKDAVVLAWWDLSRAIRLVAGRAAPLDDAHARGLLMPTAWTEATTQERARWGAGAESASAETFGRFVEALLLTDEARGAEALKKLAGGKPAYIAVHISDVWKASAARPERIVIAYRDFASTGGVTHGLIKSAQQWMRDENIQGGYAVEPMGGATRLHYFPRKSDGETLIARLLPFSTSNPARLEKMQLVYQHKGYWIYKLPD